MSGLDSFSIVEPLTNLVVQEIHGANPMNEFVVIDVENVTVKNVINGNFDDYFIYQIGVCCFVNNQVQEKWSQFINPECKNYVLYRKFKANFPDNIEDYPSFPTVINELKQRIESKILWSHGPTDRQKLGENLKRYDLNDLEPKGWHDSIKVVKTVWPRFEKKGHGLEKISEHLGITYSPHDAAEDARATGLVLIHAMQETGKTIEELADLAGTKRPTRKQTAEQETSSTGPLLNLRICFTGTPRSCRQKEIEDLARQNGATVTGSVSSKIDFLVRLEEPGYGKVAKAEKRGVRIVDEDYFHSLLSQQ